MQTNTQTLLVVAFVRNFYVLCISSEECSLQFHAIKLQRSWYANCSCFDDWNVKLQVADFCFSSLVVFLDLQTLNDISPWSNNKNHCHCLCLHYRTNHIHQLNGCDEIQEIVTMFAEKTTLVKNYLKALSCRQKWFWLKDELQPEVSFLYYLSWDLRPNPPSLWLWRDKRSSAKKNNRWFATNL